MNAIRTTVITFVAAASLLAIASPANAALDVGVTIGYPGGYGIAQPVQPLYGPAPVYVAPAPVYVPRPYYQQREEGRDWREREERAAEWRYRHGYRHDNHHGYQPDYRHDGGRNDNNWRNEWQRDRNDGAGQRFGEHRDGHR